MPKKLAGVTVYSTAEIAKKLRITEATVRAYFKSGKIKGRKIGTVWHATEKALQEFLRNGER